MITYEDKVALQEDPSVADINKWRADDANEIKKVVNELIETGIEELMVAKINTIYPVGSILINTTGTNPANYLGVGTWETWGSGRVPLGYDSSSYSTAEATGGAETVTLTTTELPSHTHSMSTHTHSISSHTHSLPSHTHSMSTHTHSYSGTTASSGAHTHNLGYDFDGASGSARYTPHSTGVSGAGYTTATTGEAGAHTHTYSGTTGSGGSTATGSTSGTSGSTSLTTASGGSTATGSTGSGSSFSILQPYIVCYMWKRTV